MENIQGGGVCVREHCRPIRNVQLSPIALGRTDFAQIVRELQVLEKKKKLVSFAGLRRRPRGGLGSEFWLFHSLTAARAEDG